ncbi:hypothetical protein BB561_002381 [Smittium simulii]|uniref:MPN domain-containing protein n=1 Tax=Smittium simulii TaxID=133385 RepID=A0A2T9YQM6_9FUNG|nr:hypothetical protein BB561_002381 [Smittium simulii]
MSQELISNLSSAKIVVHPLVLLSVVDHYNRVAKNNNKRVVGVLLGQVQGLTVNVANSFAVPFEEEFDKTTNSNVWFLDHNYVETMRDMFKKINAKEYLVGWYHSGPKLEASDLQINELFKKYVQNPLLVVINVQHQNIGLPTNAYFSVEEIQNDGTAAIKTFEHVPSEVGAEEAEEIGVEHLLRDVKDNAVGTLSKRLIMQINSLKGLAQRLLKIRQYLDSVVEGKLPINYEIIQNIQKIFNLLPKTIEYSPTENNSTPNASNSTITRATNDSFLIIYVSSMIRAIISLHDLITNKIQNRESEAVSEKVDEVVDSKQPLEKASDS